MVSFLVGHFAIPRPDPDVFRSDETLREPRMGIVVRLVWRDIPHLTVEVFQPAAVALFDCLDDAAEVIACEVVQVLLSDDRKSRQLDSWLENANATWDCLL